MDTKVNNLEIWKHIKGFEGIYEISNFGRVKSLRVKGSYKLTSSVSKIINPVNITGGYLGVRLHNNGVVKKYRIHVLVANHFLENHFNYKYVNHLNENPADNHFKNLEFVNHRENVTYSKNKKNYTSNLVGVSFNKLNIKNKWRSQIGINGKCKHIGCFSSEQEAHNAYLKALNQYGLNNKYAINPLKPTAEAHH